MDVTHVLNAVDSGYQSLAGSLLLPKGGVFASKLVVGQVIKAKVLLRHGDQNRYTVQFKSGEEVVHSEMKLAVGDHIEARVSSIKGTFVHLKRTDKGVVGESEDAKVALNTRSFRSEVLQKLSQRYSAKLSSDDLKLAQSLVRGEARGHLVALLKNILFLRKLGIVPDKNNLQHLFKNMLVKGPIDLSRDSSEVVQEDRIDVSKEPGFRSQEPESRAAAAKEYAPIELANYLRRVFSKQTVVSNENTVSQRFDQSEILRNIRGDERSGGGNEYSRNKQFGLAPVDLFNEQSDSRLGHQHQSLAFLFDDQLVELDLAIFSQRKMVDSLKGPVGENYSTAAKNNTDQDSASGLRGAKRHKFSQIAFSIKTNSLGQVDVNASVLEKRLNLDFNLTSAEVRDDFKERKHELEEMFKHYSWRVDESKYGLRQEQSEVMSLAKCAVVEKTISEDSLSRMI